MADDKHRAAPAPTQSPVEAPREQGPLFAAFPGHHMPAVDRARLPGIAVMAFANKAHAIAGGVSTLMAIREADALNESAGDPRVLSESHWGYLERLAIVALEGLAGDAHDFMTWAYEGHTEEGHAETRARSHSA